jgi:hypothetical protein
MNSEARLKLIEDRCAQYGCDGDTLWLIYRLGREAARCRGLQAQIRGLRDQVAKWLT